MIVNLISRTVVIYTIYKYFEFQTSIKLVHVYITFNIG